MTPENRPLVAQHELSAETSRGLQLGAASMTFTVRAYSLPTVLHPASSLPLYPHQIELWNAWNQNPAILLTAGTGTGKTRAAMLPVLKHAENAVAVYPTNELLKDQVRAVAGYSFRVVLDRSPQRRSVRGAVRPG